MAIATAEKGHDRTTTTTVTAITDNHDESCKIMISRIPPSFDEESVKRLLIQKAFDGDEKTIVQVQLAYKHDDDDNENNKNKHHSHQRDDSPSKKKQRNNDGDDEEEEIKVHRGFGFVTLANPELVQKAIHEIRSIKGGAKPTSKKQHTLYIGPCFTDEEKEQQQQSQNDNNNNNVCFLWVQNRCPYGDNCKFVHTGPGGSTTTTNNSNNESSIDNKKKKKKCRDYRKGKCKLGDQCPFSHDFEVRLKGKVDKMKNRPDSEKDCINWKTKGKCRKLPDCPYRHDPKYIEKLEKKKKKQLKRKNDDHMDNNNNKQQQPLVVSISGLNYETKEYEVRKYFEKHCGPIVNIDYPLSDDNSQRNKGYCTITFQSPKAVEKAIQLDKSELNGRWLHIQMKKHVISNNKKKKIMTQST